MDIKVKIYQSMPAVAKLGMTTGYIQLRKWREEREARRGRPQVEPEPVQVVYLSGFPRSGTTMLKYYFASHEGVKQSPFNPKGFFEAWDQAKTCDEILADKSNHYIYAVENLFAAYGRAVRLCVIVRDPRDCLVSFTKYQENREVPRDQGYWPYWSRQHARLLHFGEESEFGDCLYLVRYEDLVRFPEASKADFLKWLGFEVSAEDLDRRYRNENPEEGWHDSVHDYREVNDHALQKWRQAGKLPGWARENLAGWKRHPQTSELMKAFGYDEEGFTEPQFVAEKCRFFRPPGVLERN